jgi:hypothetical protein|tara:strand:- start:24 stop:524 length:501 start_codon:yes stop_codon:yes gene_type:complete
MSKIKAKLIIEIMGRPPEHVKEALNTLVVRLGSEKGVSVIDKQYHEPKPIEESKDLFIAFADVDAEFENIESFFNILMGYMPAHAEIYEPEKFKLDASNINELGNFILGKLHRYDSIAKRALMERNMIAEQLNKLKEGTSENETPKKSAKKKSSSSKKTNVSSKKK